MSILTEFANGSSVLAYGDATSHALRVTNRPPELTGAYSFLSGGATAAGPVALAPMAAFRWGDVSKCVIRRISIQMLVTTAGSAGLTAELQAYIARGWSVSDTGGTAISLSGNNNKLRTSHTTSLIATNGDIRVANAGVLTAGTRTLDSSPIISCLAWQAAGSYGSASYGPNSPEDYPIVLSQNEGIVFSNAVTFTTGVYVYRISLSWEEMASYETA